MQPIRFTRRSASFLTSGLLALLWAFFALTAVRAQEAAQCAAPQANLGTTYVTVYSTEPFINVRGGPNSYLYEKVGVLLTGESAPALGRSPGGDWIQISCPGAPGGVGWVYVANVTLTAPGDLPIVAIPVTSTPLLTATIDPTLAAAFPSAQPAATRMPTFTPAAPQTLPVFTDDAPPVPSPRVQGALIFVMIGLGLAGLLLSFFWKR